jgi:hypothetical protein
MFPQDAYHTGLAGPPNSAVLRSLAARVFAQVFRRDFSAPGVALVSLGNVAPADLRRLMVALKEALSDLSAARDGRLLAYRSLGRFNQQVTTKYHLDGGPEESYLMLGYEPTEVASALAVADCTRAAHELGITPRRLLEEHNPIFPQHERLLAPYVTPLLGFDPSQSHVLLLNNSSLPYVAGGNNSLGVMHQATVPAPRPDRNRTVNSTMIVPAGAEGLATDADVRRFLESDEVAGAMMG